MVQWNKVWIIDTIDDYNKAIAFLDDADFVAQMSDDYSVTLREQDEIAKQRAQVKAAAASKGLL